MQSRFGFVGAATKFTGNPEFDFKDAREAGAHWDRPHPGPFSWQEIEYKQGKYDFTAADAYVNSAGRGGFAVLATIWPFADWDQKKCRPVSCNAPDFGELATMRCKPCDMEAYKEFLKATVARYSKGSYPVKYWEVMNEPAIRGGLEFFKGSVSEYVEILNESYEVIKEACPDCTVLHGGVEGSDKQFLDFFSQALALGAADSFDVANIHSINDAGDANVGAFRTLLMNRSVSKPVWVTEVSFGSARYWPRQMPEYRNFYITDDEHAQILFKGVVKAFGAGAQKVFYTTLWADPYQTEQMQSEALINSGGSKRPAYSAYKTLAAKIDYFDNVRKISEGQYKFTAGERTIFVLWGKQPLPAGLPEKISVTDYSGRVSKIDSSQFKPSDSPVIVEAA